MEQFNLEKWLQNKSRKVVTRDGHNTCIVSAEKLGNKPIIAIVELDTSDEVYMFYPDGRQEKHKEYDLFFADEEEELTELQKTLEEDCDCYVNLYNDGKTREELREWIKVWCPRIIDLAREELLKEQQEKLGTLEMPIDVTEPYYIKGKQDTLKDLPKLEKTEDVIDPTIPVMYTNAASMKSYVEYNGFKVCINELFETLPKEE